VGSRKTGGLEFMTRFYRAACFNYACFTKRSDAEFMQ
jgi:hypothetical protein